MQWLLQDFEDTRKLAEALDRHGVPYSWHKVVPYVGDLAPEPEIIDLNDVVMFGSYALWRYAERRRLSPGVFTIRPFVHEAPWRSHVLNGPGAVFLMLQEIPLRLPDDGRTWFVRPVADSKELAGAVMTARELIDTAGRVVALDEAEIPEGSLRHDTMLMLAPPAIIRKEWRVWIVDDAVVAYSLYKEGARVVYRQEIDDDALAFAKRMARLNPAYAPAYVMDICRTDAGLRLLETNCINAAGFYAADLNKLVVAIESLDPGGLQRSS